MSAVDVRARLALFFSLVAVMVLTPEHLYALGLTAGVFVLGFALGAGRALVRTLYALGVMVAVVAAISLAFFGPLEGLLAGLRFVGLLALGVVFFATTGAEELARGLTRLKVPYPAVFVMATAMNYVPLMKERLAQVRDAQRARGIAVGFRPSRLKNLPALLVPVLIHSFLLADDLALAMEARGFNRPERRRIEKKGLTVLDWAVVALSVLILALRVAWLWKSRT